MDCGERSRQPSERQHLCLCPGRKRRAYIYLPVLGKGGSQKGGDAQDAVFHVHQPANAVIHDHVGGVQVTKEHASFVEDLQALHKWNISQSCVCFCSSQTTSVTAAGFYVFLDACAHLCTSRICRPYFLMSCSSRPSLFFGLQYFFR